MQNMLRPHLINHIGSSIKNLADLIIAIETNNLSDERIISKINEAAELLKQVPK